MAGILVADSDKTLSQLLVISLRREGHWVVWAIDGERALAYMHEADFDMCVLGERMPDMPTEWLLHLFRRECASFPAVLILGAEGSPHRLNEWRASGARDFMTKPARLPHLIQRIERILGEKAQTP